MVIERVSVIKEWVVINWQKNFKTTKSKKQELIEIEICILEFKWRDENFSTVDYFALANQYNEHMLLRQHYKIYGEILSFTSDRISLKVIDIYRI